MILRKLIVMAVTVFITSSCATSNQKQEALQAANEAVGTPTNWATAAETYGDASIKWLGTFNDPQLLKLIHEGKNNNFDLQTASGNMEKAWLLAEQSGAALKPTVNLVAGTKGVGTGEVSAKSNNNVGLQASWELDVWGRIRSGVYAATASAQAVQADYDAAQNSLSANIAKTYFKMIEAKQQTQITNKNLSILNDTMRITQFQYDNGMTSKQDIALNKANLAAAKDQLINLQGSQRSAMRSLELLLGRYPSATIDIPDALPRLPVSPPAGLPSDMLERRPDVVSAERKIAAAFNQTNAAKAARLPNFSLTASLGGASGALADILNPTNVAWQLGASLLAPVFDGGKRKIDIEIATVEQKQAISAYAQTALTAFSEVENNLDQGNVLAERETVLSEAENESAKAYSIADLRYKEGEIGLLDTLQIQQQSINAESSLLAVRRKALEQRVNLYLALGGSW